MGYRHDPGNDKASGYGERARVSLLGPALLGWLGGTALHLQRASLPQAGVTWITCATCVMLLMYCIRRQVRSGQGWSASWHGVIIVATLMALLADAGASLRARAFLGQALDSTLEDRDLIVRGRVASMPQNQGDAMRMQFVIEQAWQEGVRIRLPRKVSLSWPGGNVRAGDRCELQVRLRAPHGLRNPYGFDFELWMWEQGLQATGRVRQGRHDAPAQCNGDSGRHPIERWRQKVRDAILSRNAEPRALGTVAALVTGDQQSIARADWALFRDTGVSHLMSISGLHITLFAWMAQHALSWIWRRRTSLCLWAAAPQAAGWGGLILATLYAVFSGWAVPAQRTVLMLGISTLLRLSGRTWPALSIWLSAGTVVVMVDPWALLQPGFWLSFVAVGVLMTSVEEPMPLTAARSPARRTLDAVLDMTRQQALVTFALAPLTLVWFGQFSLLGLVANLAAIPWVTIVVTPLAFLGALWGPATDLAAGSAAWLLAGLEWLASWPLPRWHWPQAPLWAGVAAVSGGWLLMTRAPASLKALGAGLLLPLLLWRTPAPVAGQYTLLGVDVGQGQAVLVRTASHTLLYDSGPLYGEQDNAGERVLVPLLHALGLEPDLLLLSHRDHDHTGGAASVLAAFPRTALLATLENGHPLLAHPGATHCRAGQHWEWDGVRFDILHPSAETSAREQNSNAGSCVLRISNGQQVALLAGDLEKAQERFLVAQSQPLRADWLLVPHHGSRTSSTPEFLQAVQPRLALVQSGHRNHYGHPAPDVMARYHALGTVVRASPSCGAAMWSTVRPDHMDCERTLRSRYWQHNLNPSDPLTER